MLLLSALLMGSMLAVAYVAVNRLAEVNARVRQLVDGTTVKREVLSELQAKFLAGVRAQKYAILAPDDEGSKENAAAARALLADAGAALERIKGSTSADRVEGQAAAVQALDKSLSAFTKLNNETLDLAVLNTNVKAKKLLKGDLQRPTNLLAALLRRWISGVAAKQAPTTADVSRLKLISDIQVSLLEMYPILVRHIESSSKEEMTAEAKRLADHQDQIQAALATVSEGDPSGQVESRAALTEIKSLQDSIIKLSETDSNNRSAALSLGETKILVDECMARIGDLDKLFAAEAMTGRDKSAAAYTSGMGWILGVMLMGLVVGGVGA